MTRIIAIAGIFAFAIFSLVVFDRTIQPPADRGAEAEASDDDDSDEFDEGPAPAFLSFAAEFDSGEYQVGDSNISSIRRADKDVVQRDRDLEDSDRTPLDDLPTIEPGLYTTDFGVTDCSYELSAVHKDRVERSIGTDSLPEGRLLVTIDESEPDRFTADENCGGWSEWSGLQDQLTSASNGDYWTGDLAPGVWRVPTGCIWEKVVAFRGSRLSDVEDIGIGPVPLEVDRETPGVRIRGCKAPIVFVSSS